MNNPELLVAIVALYCDHIDDWQYENNKPARGFLETLIANLAKKIKEDV